MTSSENFGPEELGRGIVVPLDGPVPETFRDAPRHRLEEKALVNPRHLIRALNGHWLKRERCVIELALDKQELKKPERLDLEPFQLDPGFEFAQERLHFLLWANNYDATGGEPIWWYKVLALKLGASPHPEAEVDLEGPVWCDGGPRCHLPFPVLHRESIKARRLQFTRPGSDRLEELAPDQALAVAHNGGPARIIAPAGSGKTRVLTRRFSNLLDRGVEPALITAVAYNRRAAREMQDRLGGSNYSIRTLHSLGHSLLRQARGVRVASQQQVRGILRSLVKLPPQLNIDPYQPYLEALQQARLALRDPKELEMERDDVPGFSSIFRRYRRRLSEQGLVDHDEQIYGAIELLLSEPDWRKRAQLSCTHLLVDEFQDLTPAFLLLIRLLCGPAYQLFAVGDDDQVIYGYAGATPEYLVNFEEYFPGASPYQLRTNYRCPEPVVRMASRILESNTLRVPKEVEVWSEVQRAPEAALAPQEEWAELCVEHIQDWLEDYQPSQIAVLSRVNSLLLPLQVMLTRLEIPHSKVVDLNILSRTGVRTALAYWRLCHDPENMEAEDLQDALRRPNRKLKREYIDGAARCHDRMSLRRYGMTLDDWPSSQIDEFLNDLAFLQRKLEKGHNAFFKALRLETLFTEALQQLDEGGLGSAGSSHEDDLIALEQLSHLCEEDNFEEWLRGWLAVEPSSEPGIRLSSVHRVKGLEWPCVAIYGVEQGLFPHRLSDDLEEERRILHVALTRTRERCLLVASRDSISPFVGVR